jgi:spermidine synthase
LDERIVHAARQHFSLPPDGERLRVEVGDGAEALSPECCDLLVIDAYHDEAHVPELSSGEFYDGAWLALREPGVMVVNYMDDDPKFDEYLQRLERAFGGAVLAMPALYDPNVIVFALKGLPPQVEWRELRAAAERLEAQLDIPFTRYLPKLRGMNRCTRDALILAGA